MIKGWGTDWNTPESPAQPSLGWAGSAPRQHETLAAAGAGPAVPLIEVEATEDWIKID